jgi:hypothetical protein
MGFGGDCACCVQQCFDVDNDGTPLNSKKDCETCVNCSFMCCCWCAMMCGESAKEKCCCSCYKVAEKEDKEKKEKKKAAVSPAPEGGAPTTQQIDR